LAAACAVLILAGIFRRDGWLCRWCGKPVIFGPAMKSLEREIRKAGMATPLAYYHARWTRDGAPLLDHLGAVLDHVEAFSTGGMDSTGISLRPATNATHGRVPLVLWITTSGIRPSQ
jgi:hypothetical protein